MRCVRPLACVGADFRALDHFCDLRYAVAGAKMTTAAPVLGLSAEYGLSWEIPADHRVHPCGGILLTGRIFTSDEAKTMRFLNAVYTAEKFEAEVMRVAHSIAGSASPSAMKAAKRQMYADLLRHDVGGASRNRGR